MRQGKYSVDIMQNEIPSTKSACSICKCEGAFIQFNYLKKKKRKKNLDFVQKNHKPHMNDSSRVTY